MKILHLLYSGLGGHGNVFFSMIEADSNRLYKFEALFNGVENVRIEYLEKCKEKGINWKYINKKPGLDLRFYKNLYTAIRHSDADIIFLHGSTQILWAKLATLFCKKKKRVIVRETQANDLKTKQDWIWLVVAMLVADKLVFLTEQYKSEIKKRLPWIFSVNKTAVIPNGINLSEFKPAVKVPGDTITMGMQSRIVKIKDYETLIRAFADVLRETKKINKKIALQIAGDGDFRKELEQLVRELKIDEEVIFRGMLTQQELILFLNDLDIYIHASFGETMSTAIMQAMACGKPIIASDVDGINNMVINNVTGLLVPVNNAVAMANAVLYLINDPEKVKQLSANSIKFAAHNFSNNKMFERYSSIFSTTFN